MGTIIKKQIFDGLHEGRWIGDYICSFTINTKTKIETEYHIKAPLYFNGNRRVSFTTKNNIIIEFTIFST